MANPKEIMERMEMLRTERGNFEQLWQEVADYIIPDKGGFNVEKSPGQKLNHKILDSTGPWAAQTLTSALYGYITNPAAPWFTLGTLDPNIAMTNRDAMGWMQLATRHLYSLFASPRKRFYDQSHEMLQDVVPFGTGIMKVEERYNYGTVFKAQSLTECYLDENYSGIVDVCFRRFKLTTRQIVQEFGMPNIPNFEKFLEKEPMRKWDCIHAVYPRDDRKVQKLNALNMPYASCYVLEEHRYELRESGYNEFPILSPRWTKRSNEVYGRGPGIIAVSDIRMLNEMKRTTLKGAQKIVDPPMMAPDDTFLAPIDQTMGAMNFYTPGYTNDKLEPIVSGGRPEIGRELMNDEKEAILRAFYVDKLQDSKSPTVEQTRTEWLGNQQERLIQMAPQLGRCHNEYTGPLIEITLMKELRAGRLPPPPDSIKNIPMMVQYLSPLARAQKQAQLDSITGAMQILQPLATVKPEIMDYINEGGLTGWVFNIFDTPNECTNPAEKVQQIQQQRQEQQEQQAQIQGMMGAASAAKDGASAMATMRPPQ